MSKRKGQKRKLTAAEKRAKRERKRKYKWIFINGKQVRVKREPTIDGIPVDDWVLQNADPIFLHQNGMWEYMVMEDDGSSGAAETSDHSSTNPDDDIPF